MKTSSLAGRLLPLCALLYAVPLPPLLAQDPAPAAGEDAGAADTTTDADVESLGKAAERFVEAFNKKDAAAIAALFLETGEIVSRDGDNIEGRDEIKAFYEDLFAGDKVPQIALEASSVRLLAPGVAIEDGVIHFTTAENEPVKSISYSATQVKQSDGTWLIASTRDQLEVTAPAEHLKPLAWLEGEWTYQGEDGVHMELALDLDDSGNFLLGEAVATDEDGDVQNTSIRIGWNPACSSVYWWTFDSEGGNASGQWTRNGDAWMIRTSGVTADAEPNAATQKLTRDGDDTIVWNSTDRVMAGEPQPDIEVRFVRRAPDPDAGATAALPEDGHSDEEATESNDTTESEGE